MNTTPTTPHRQPVGRMVTEVPAHIGAAFDELREQYRHACALPHTTDTEHAERAERIAIVSARLAGWWGVLARWTYRGSGLDHLHGRAAFVARRAERDAARFWRDTAADWRARAERRPTSDAAGALSNWDELGVTA